ncbi:MAG: 2-oxo-4-hydroxy-4-carboxy-5-ureidoimidazoline decarboxylase [Acidobacteriia bacterium]|nr:2-oxo-4-hydroxy-4-carboxy-5-ureidoimidazoline decarboxylase [Terriglobia bacterium]
MTIGELNTLPLDRFVEQIGWVFEHSPWVAERAWKRRPFATPEALHAGMRDEVERATREEQLALLRAHPALGTRNLVSAASQSEQAGAGLHQVTLEGAEYLERLNSDYHRKFGFPFIYAVKGSPPADILFSLTVRLDGTPEEEFHEALYQVHRIAWFRLSDCLKGE